MIFAVLELSLYRPYSEFYKLTIYHLSVMKIIIERVYHGHGHISSVTARHSLGPL